MRKRKLQKQSLEELAVLKTAEKTSSDPKLRRRSHALLLMYEKGKGMKEIMEIFSIDRDTLCRWLNRYESEGIIGLQDRARSGRPVKDKKKLLKKI